MEDFPNLSVTGRAQELRLLYILELGVCFRFLRNTAPFYAYALLFSPDDQLGKICGVSSPF